MTKIIKKIQDNPLVLRYYYSTCRPKSLWIYSLTYSFVLAVILFMNYYRMHIFNESLIEAHQAIYYIFFAFQVIILFIWASYNSGTAIPRDILRKSYDFFKLLPLSAFDKTVGIVVGTNIIAYSMAIANFAIMLIFGSLGGINFYIQFLVLLNIIAVTLLLNLATLLSSINMEVKKLRRGGGDGIIILGVLFVPQLIAFWYHVLFATGNKNPQQVMFFNIKTDLFLLIAFIVLYLAFWVLLGIMRKFKFERDALFNFKGALLFYTGCEFILMGIFLPYLKNGMYNAMLAYRLLALGILSIVCLGGYVSESKYVEMISKARFAAGGEVFGEFLRRTNFMLWLSLLALWSIGCLAGSAKIGAFFAANIGYFLNPVLFVLFYLMLIEFHVLYNRETPKIKFLLIFVGVTTILLPLIAAGVFQDTKLVMHSFMGYIVSLNIDTKNIDFIRDGHLQVLIVNLSICLLSGLWIFGKYKRLLILKTENTSK